MVIMNNSKVYIIIVTYNAMKWIDRCLSSIKSSNVKAEVVVVDNCSRDETLSYIKENFSSVHIIENKENRGFGQANNQGIEWAYKQGGTHFFLLNQDAYIHKDTIEKLVSVQDKYNIALVSPIHLNGAGDKLDYNFYRKIVPDEDNIQYVGDTELGQQKDYYPVFKINAAAWLLSRRCIEKIGGFDPLYFHYGEDGNYCQRLKYHKEECVFVPGTYIHHDRELQGNMQVYKKNEVIMQLLFAYTDVNSKPWRINSKKLIMHGSHIKRGFLALIKLKFKDLRNIIGGYWEFIRKIPHIKYSMSSNCKTDATWLNLEQGVSGLKH